MNVRVPVHVYSDASTSRQVSEYVDDADYEANVTALRERVLTDLDNQAASIIIGGEVWPKVSIHHVRIGVD